MPVYAPAAPTAPAIPPAPACRLKLISSANNKAVATTILNANVPKSFGRTQRANFILNPADSNLSGLHFSLKWDGTGLLLKDLNSTNGTGVNRSLAQPSVWTPIANGVTIQAGSFEYTVMLTSL